jgi:hypothetical protein
MQQAQRSGEGGRFGPETNDSKWRGAARLGFVLAVLSTQGCAVATGEENEPISLSSDELVVQVNNLWQPSDFPLSVCFQTTSDADQPQRDAVRQAVEASWVAKSNGVVSFSGWGTCSNDNTGADVKLFLDSSVERSSAPNGTQNRISGQRVELRTPNSVPNTNLGYAYRHEFGHVLGIRHEQRHPDRDLLDAACTDDEDLGTATVLSDYDHDAIMNYCADVTELFTSQEEMFLEMAYRSVSDHPLRHQFGLYIEGALLVPNAGSFVPDWTWRGARAAAYISNGDLMAWKFVQNGAVFTDGFGIEYPVSELPAGAQLEGAFQDFRGASHTIARATVQPNTDLHTAMVLSAVFP